MQDFYVAMTTGIIFILVVGVGMLVGRGKGTSIFPSDNRFKMGDMVYYKNPQGYRIYGTIKQIDGDRRRIVSPTGVGYTSIWVNVKHLNKD